MAHKEFLYPGSTSSLIIIHGGCFVNGDETWNLDQAKALSVAWKTNTYTLNFSKLNLQETHCDIGQFFDWIHDKHKEAPSLMGISSGGFLVLEFMEWLDPKAVYLIAPVLSPKGREEFVKDERIIKHQQDYFQGKVPMRSKSSRNHVNVLLSDTDENIPFKLTMEELRRFPRKKVVVLEGKTHKEVCLNIDDIIKNF